MLIFIWLLAWLMPGPTEKATYLYELRLRDRYSHQVDWNEKERSIQQAHLAYLDSLTQIGKIQLGGILDQGLDTHTGFVLLKVNSFEEAQAITLMDPAIQEGLNGSKN